MTCPDCTAAVPAGVVLEHDPTCPLGRAAEVTGAADAAWFAAHPSARWYWRDVTLDEQTEAKIR